MYHKMTC